MQNDSIKNISVIILTYNEELNISQALKNITGWAKEIIVLDSGSTDNTVKIAESFGAKVFHRQFDNYANQRNYALKELPISTEWILFLDADEYLSEELKKEISDTLAQTDCDGFYLKRRFYFWNKWIKHGGYYPIWILRLFKKDKGHIEREINEHFVVDGKVGYLKNDFIDNNKKDLTEWIAKHNKYATYEAEELLKYKQRKQAGKKDEFANLSGSQAQKKRWIREYIWNPLMPPLIRPFIYFFYRYIIRLGFLDGKAGFVYHILQGLWYPFLIDVKYLELKKKHLTTDNTN
jgi:glycosyltransferase involved in cell wall biosynthesis